MAAWRACPPAARRVARDSVTVGGSGCGRADTRQTRLRSVSVGHQAVVSHAAAPPAPRAMRFAEGSNLRPPGGCSRFGSAFAARGPDATGPRDGPARRRRRSAPAGLAMARRWPPMRHGRRRWVRPGCKAMAGRRIARAARPNPSGAPAPPPRHRAPGRPPGAPAPRRSPGPRRWPAGRRRRRPAPPPPAAASPPVRGRRGRAARLRPRPWRSGDNTGRPRPGGSRSPSRPGRTRRPAPPPGAAAAAARRAPACPAAAACRGRRRPEGWPRPPGR